MHLINFSLLWKIEFRFLNVDLFSAIYTFDISTWSINSIFLISITIIHFSSSNHRAALTSLGRSLSSTELYRVGFVLGAWGRITAAGIFVWAAWLASGPRFALFCFSLELFPFFLFSLCFCFDCFYFLVYFVDHQSISSFGLVNGVSAETFEVGNGILYHFNGLLVIARDVTWIAAGGAALGGVTGFTFCHFGLESGGLKSWSAFPHYPVVSLVHGNGELEEAKFFAEKLAEPPVGEPLAALASCEPDSCKVTGVADVLSHSYSSIQVNNSVPPPSRHKHGLSRVLNALYHLRQSPLWIQMFSPFQSWKNKIKIVYGLIIFSLVHQMLSSHESLVYLWRRWYQNPSFVALHWGVPCACAQWVLMDFRAWSLWPYQKPPMRWLILLWQEIIKIVPEVLRLCVVLLHHMGFWVLFKAAFK